MTAECPEERDVEAVRPRLRQMAIHWHQRWAWHQDRVLVEDLEARGLLVLAELGRDHPRLWWEVQNAMQDEIAHWLYGVMRGQQPRRVEVVPLTRVASTVSREAWPDRVAEGRVVVDQLWREATGQERLVLGWIAAHGQCLPRRIYRAAGMSQDVVHDRRVSLRRKAQRILGLPAGRTYTIERRPLSWGSPSSVARRPAGISLALMT